MTCDKCINRLVSRDFGKIVTCKSKCGNTFRSPSVGGYNYCVKCSSELSICRVCGDKL